MMMLVFNFKSGNKLEIPIKKSLTSTEFRQFLAILKRDTCVTDQNLVDNFYFIDVDMIESVALIEKKQRVKLKEQA